MPQLYELLAVEPELRQQAQAKLKDISLIFSKGAGRFVGQLTSFNVLLEGEPEIEDEEMVLATTVEKELQSLFHVYGGYLDVTIQKEVTNTNTRATVEIGDINFDLPATALLNLESRLEELRKVYARIPTLDPSEVWVFDVGQERYVSKVRSTIRTKKVPKTIVKYDATVEHPAQVELFNEDVPAYKLEKTVFSGALTVAAKTARIERIDELIRLVKKARQRANDTELDFGKISEALEEYING